MSTGVIVSGLVLVAVWVVSRWVRRCESRIPGRYAGDVWERETAPSPAVCCSDWETGR